MHRFSANSLTILRQSPLPDLSSTASLPSLSNKLVYQSQQALRIRWPRRCFPLASHSKDMPNGTIEIKETGVSLYWRSL